MLYGSRCQAKLEPLRGSLNVTLKETWQEWEIPRDADASWSAEAMTLHAEWWQTRIAQQSAIDASIAAKAEFEFSTISHIRTTRRSVSRVRLPLRVLVRIVYSASMKTMS